MLQWLSMNWQTVLVASVLGSIVAVIIIKMIKDKKAGRSGCGCGCDGCALSDQCKGKITK